MDGALMVDGSICLKLMKYKLTKVVVATIWVTQRLTKRCVKTWVDLAWFATFVKKAYEQL
jgi:hypothetical protein